MMFRNSYRLLLANFGTFWKNFLYKLIVISIIILLVLPVWNNITSLSQFNEILQNGQTLFLTVPFTNIPQYIEMLFEFIKVFLNFFVNIFVFETFSAIYLTIIFSIVMPFLFSLSSLAVGEVLYGYMSSQVKYGFVPSFIKKIGKASVQSIFKTLITLPFSVLTFVVLYALLYLNYINLIPMILLPVLILIFLIMILSFNITLFSGWTPSIIVFNCGVFKAIKKGMIAVFRRFFRSYSTVCMILLCYILLANLFGFLSLILLLPILSLNLIIFEMVMFFGSQGMRYYVDPDTILSPKKLEETDKFKKVVNII